MHYDVFKQKLGYFFGKNKLSRRIFYKLLDLLLLRAWHIHKEIRHWAANNKDQQVHIMDAGAGFGQHTYYLSKMSPKWSIYAVDIQKERVCDCNTFFHAQQLNNVFCKTHDLTTLNKEEIFDMILSVDVLTHIDDDVCVLGNFHKALKDGGMLLMCSPSIQAGTAAFDGGKSVSVTGRVRNGYDKKELRAKLTEAGFSKIAMRYIYGKFGRLSWKLSMKYPIALLDKSEYFALLLPIYYLFTYPVSYALNWLDMRWNHTKGMGLLVKAWK